jgi:tetratricopeptide (TPR) repeat protein
MKGELEAAGIIARRALAADAAAAEPHIILGHIAAAQNRLASAFIEYQQAVLLDQNSSEAVAGLAKIYRKGSITRATLRRMERVAASPPASPSLMEVVGRLYAERGWHADAERALEQATKLDPERATAATALALTYARHGKDRAAVDSLAMTGESAAELVAGLRATEEKNLAAAVESYESAVRRGEPSGAAANNLAWIYAQRGIELDRALELAQLARRLEPRDPAVLDTVGFVQLKRREYSEAVASLKQAIELAQSPTAKPMSPGTLREVKLHLAEAYMRTGQPEEAAAMKNSLR